MIRKDRFENLKELIAQLEEAATHLKISFVRCTAIDKGATDQDSLIELEALTGRFARLTDILIHKIYRAIDAVELVEGGTLIDVMNRADKRQLINSVQEIRYLKDLRNDIAHEYIADRIQLLHEEVLECSPKLLDLVDRAISYAKNLS